MKDFQPALFVTGIVLMMLAMLMVWPIIFLPGDGHYNWHAFTGSAAITFTSGLILVSLFRRQIQNLRPRQLFLITILTWLAATVFSALPFIMTGVTVTDSIFESASGLTTTGSTVLTGLDGMTHDILLWRSLLQWIGGIGIIGMAVAVLPFLGVGGMRLFKTESSEWSEKAMPRTRALAISLLIVYIILSMMCALAFWLFGMSFFDAINHAMSTISTGGYSTHDASFQYFNSYSLQWIAVLFMILGSLPFVLYVRFWRRGESTILFKDVQVRGFLLIVMLVSLLLAGSLVIVDHKPWFHALTLSFFNVVSVITTTGYMSEDYVQWGGLAVALFFLIMFVGGCSGSTAGGMKIFRFQLSGIILKEQIYKLVHPKIVFYRRYNGNMISDDIVTSAVAFSFMYFISIGFITVLLTAMGLNLETALSGALTALGNIGPGLGTAIGPASNFKALPDAVKWILSAAMILGRLELLGVIVVFTPHFWRG